MIEHIAYLTYLRILHFDLFWKSYGSDRLISWVEANELLVPKHFSWKVKVLWGDQHEPWLQSLHSTAVHESADELKEDYLD